MKYQNRNTIDNTTFNERQKRLIIVFTTTIGLIWAVLKVLFDFMIKCFNIYYIDNSRMSAIIGMEHILISIFFISGLIILGSALFYCYHEYPNFYKEKSSQKRIQNQERADKSYKTWINNMQFSISMIIVSLVVLVIIYSPFNFYTKIGFFVIIITLAIIYWKSEREESKKQVKNFFQYIKKNKLLLLFYFLFLILCILSGFLLTGDILEKKFQIKFNNENMLSMEVFFINNMPETVRVRVKTSQSEDFQNIVTIKGEDLDKVLFESVYFEQNDVFDKSSKKKKFVYSKSYSEYKKAVNLIGKFTEGKNYIELLFTTNKDGCYRFVNQVDVEEGEITFAKKTFSIKL